jgi:hypothetical protein
LTIQIIREAAGHKRRWSVYLPAARVMAVNLSTQKKGKRGTYYGRINRKTCGTYSGKWGIPGRGARPAGKTAHPIPV